MKKLFIIYFFTTLSNFCNNKNLKKYNFSFYFGFNLLDIAEHWEKTFSFSEYKLSDNFFYLERYNVGSSFNIKISKNLDYYISLGFGIGSYIDEPNIHSLLFLELLPIGFSYNIDKFLSAGLQIGYNILINPKNNFKNAFYINFKDICIYLNIIRYKNTFLFCFSKKLKFYNILKCKLESLFINGWNIKLGISI